MHTRRTKILLPLLLVVVAIGLTACPSRVTIKQINADPDRYLNKEVGVIGKVTDSYGVPLVGGAYEIDDGTGRLWVLSEKGAPSKGSEVGVKGRVVVGPVFKGRTFGTAIQESDRRVK